MSDVPIQHITNIEEYNEIISKNACVVKFTGTWCGPCKKMAPIYEKLAETYGDFAKFVEVDIDSAKEITRKESIQSIPLFLFYSFGTPITTLTVRGANSAILASNVATFVYHLNELFGQMSSTESGSGTDSEELSPILEEIEEIQEPEPVTLDRK